MIRKGIVTFSFICLWISAVALAANVWETEPFMTWSDKEVQTAMSDSLWSRHVNVVLNSIGRGGNLGESEGRGGGRGGGGRGGGITVPPQLKLLVTWRSALPMKQALVRAQIGLGETIPAESQQLLERTESLYVVTIEGLPLQYARAVEGMNTTTFLKRDRKDPIAAAETASQKTATGLVVVFAFPKTDGITLQDKEVELVTKLGHVDIKKKFNLKDMMFHGQLEL